MICRQLLNIVSLVHEPVDQLLLELLCSWSGLAAPDSKYVPCRMKFRLAYLVEGLSVDDPIIPSSASPFLDKWTSSLKRKLHIFVKSFSFWRACSILHGIDFRLDLLAPTLVEESRQVSSQSRPFLREEVTCPEKGTMKHLAELPQRRTIAL